MKKNDAELNQAIKNFWNYFEAEHANLVEEGSAENQINTINESLYLELLDKLKEVHPDLCVEIGYQFSPRQLVISADGIDDVFEYVEMVDTHKPKTSSMLGWEVIKYRQHRDDIEEQTITIGEETIALSEVLFDLIIDDEAGIVVVMFIPGFDEDNDAHEMLRWVILDNTIGEYAAVKKVGYFATYSTDAMKDLDKKMTAEFKTLRHLRQDLDELWKKHSAANKK
jgi:hypothetical protein